MPFNLRSGSVPDGSITNAKLADDSVSTIKIQADAVTTAKTTREVVTEQFFGTEASLLSIGVTPTNVGEFNFIKNATNEANWKTLSWQIKLQSSVGTNTATARIKIDGSQVGSDLTTVATSPTILSGLGIDITSLANGNHLVVLELENSGSSDTATLTQADIFLAKK